MRSILKALGLTIWGAIAILLSVIFIVVGYELALKYRFSIASLSFEQALNDQNSQSKSAEPAASVALPDRTPDVPVPEVVARAAEETDCANAREMPRVALDAAQRARLARLLDSTAAAKAESGDAFVWLGERYYGFGEYELAIASIERGLEKGHVVHLDDAYVYLGRSEVAIGDLDAARDAFAKLQDVPNISPSVLRLWMSYAEMLSPNSKSGSVPAAECRKSGP
jgi:tetratricopeptide (TPR) repeat protein